MTDQTRYQQWYANSRHDEYYENPHVLTEAERDLFLVKEDRKRPFQVIEAAMLERALFLSGELPHARADDPPRHGTGGRTSLPRVQFMNVVIRFGDESVVYDAFQEEMAERWPEKADEIELFAKVVHPDGTKETKSYRLDVALAPKEPFEQAGPSGQNTEMPLVIVSKNSRVGLGRLSLVLARAEMAKLPLGDAPDTQEIDEIADRARAMAHIALLGMNARLTVAEDLARTYIARAIPPAAIKAGPFTLELFLNGQPRINASNGIQPSVTGDDDRVSRKRENRRRYKGTELYDHPGVEHGWPVERGTNLWNAILRTQAKNGEKLMELGTRVHGQLVPLTVPEDLDQEIPVGATEAVVWSTGQPDWPSPAAAVHLLSGDDVRRLRTRSTSILVNDVINAARNDEETGTATLPDAVKSLAAKHKPTTENRTKQANAGDPAGSRRSPHQAAEAPGLDR